MDVPDWQKKQKEFEKVKARAKALKLRLTCTICGAKAKLNCPCETTQYCSVACQKVDWRERGHRTACKKIRKERAAEAARAEAPTPPREVFYGPAPRSHADEIRARIAAEHEAARARREANPEPEPTSARFGSRCPICLGEWDVNGSDVFLTCCARLICRSCEDRNDERTCALCRAPVAKNDAEGLARLRRHVENEVPEAIHHLGQMYVYGVNENLPQSYKKAKKLYKRGAELGDPSSMYSLGYLLEHGFDGIKVNKKKAKQLYQRAADRASYQRIMPHLSSSTRKVLRVTGSPFAIASWQQTEDIPKRSTLSASTTRMAWVSTSTSKRPGAGTRARPRRAMRKPRLLSRNSTQKSHSRNSTREHPDSQARVAKTATLCA
jgi:hypothetical protein